MALVKRELAWAIQYFPSIPVSTIYFGGGTPSLIPPSDLINFMAELQELGRPLHLLDEVTVEINPGTITEQDLVELQRGGITRFSVGTQTFQPELLPSLGREHTVQSSLDTLTLLKKSSANFTMDLLYGLPNQSLNDLEKDLEVIASFTPHHLSAYNLTVPEEHFLNRGRPSDETQVEMYHKIVESLAALELLPYEISNFARRGSESLHNSIYWQDGTYWALGMSGHSYLPRRGPWGTRFKNPSSMSSYGRWVANLAGKSFEEGFHGSFREDLTKDQSVVDFVHTSLRQARGLSRDNFVTKFDESEWMGLSMPLCELEQRGLMESSPFGYRLTPDGRLLFNSVLSHLFT